MSIKIGNYEFEGPFRATADLRNQSGVYAILGWNFVNGKWKVIDIGWSKHVRSRVENHDREDYWKKQNYATLNCAAYYCDSYSCLRVPNKKR